MTSGGRGASAAFFYQQNSRSHVPFISAGQGDRRIRLTGCHERKRVGDGSDWAAVEMVLQAFEPADPEFPWIDERDRPFG